MPSTRTFQPPSTSQLFRHLGPSLVLNGLMPYVVYRLAVPYCSILAALGWSAVPALLGTLFGFVRQRRIDPIGVGTLLYISASLLMAVLGHNARFVLLRGPLLNAVLGSACLLSLLLRRPIWYYIIRYFLTSGAVSPQTPARQDGETVDEQVPADPSILPAEEMSGYLASAAFLRYTRVVTIVWSVMLLGVAVAGAVLVSKLSIPNFLLAEPFIGHSGDASAVVFTILYGRYCLRTSAEMKPLAAILAGNSND